jgi:hypothetical protein
MLRKMNIKIMVVIICSAMFSLYGVVGASEKESLVESEIKLIL